MIYKIKIYNIKETIHKYMKKAYLILNFSFMAVSGAELGVCNGDKGVNKKK